MASGGSGEAPYEIVGPFEEHAVVIDGRRVPFLNAVPGDGAVHLVLDNRLGLDLSVVDADTVIPFIADCIAVALGFTSHPSEGVDPPFTRSPFQRMTQIGIEDERG